jgi:hypothetical protein
MTYAERFRSARWYCLLASLRWPTQRDVAQRLIDSAALALAGVDDPEREEELPEHATGED